MTKQLEVESIGGLSRVGFEELKRKLERKGVFKKKKKRLSFMYFRGEIPKDISELKDEDTDLRLRITNKKPEIVVKKGLFTGTHSRKEISITFPKNKIENYVGFLSSIGWNQGVIYATEILVYEYKGIEFSLVTIKDYGYNFEAEILTSKKEESNARNKIDLILKEFKLMPFNEQELNKQCNVINNKKELRFNFLKQNFNEFKINFPEFFD